MSHSYHFPAKKSLGQNFLVSVAVARRIVDAVSALPGDLVFEIGPGHGALTAPLADSGADIVAYEIDASLVGELQGKYHAHDRIEIIHADIREVDLDLAARERGKESYKIVGNIPYHLTSTILLDLPRWKECSVSVLMVQREVGERIQASPGERNCGILSIFLQSYLDIERVTRVRPGSFRPMPNVESVILKFTPAVTERGSKDREGFLAFLKGCFLHRRKKLRNSFRDTFGMRDAEELSRMARAADVDLDMRPEEISLEDWVRLFARFNEMTESR